MYGGKGYYGGRGQEPRGVFSRDRGDGAVSDRGPHQNDRGPHPNDRGARPGDRPDRGTLPDRGPRPGDRGPIRERSRSGDRYRRPPDRLERPGGYREAGRPWDTRERPGERPHERGAAVPPPASMAVPSGGPARAEPSIYVSGCSNETVSNIIQGTYTTTETNHGKPIYKKDGPNSVTVLIYYWDSRDGASFNGWWFGPKVGGDQVWAYNAGHPRDNGMPPPSNWKVPWDGKVDDRLRITIGGGVDRREEERRQERQRQEKRRREEEEERRREEARRRRQKEEEQARREAEARQQEAAANNVRKVLKKLRTATPDNLKELQAELDRAASSNFQAMGHLRDSVNDEMQNTLTQVQKRIAEELKQREEAQRRRQLELARVENLVKEAAVEVDSAEARVAEASASTTAVTAGGSASPAEVLETVAVAIKDLDEAKGSLDRSEKVLIAKKEQMGAGEGARHVKKEVDELAKRIQTFKDTVSKHTKTLEDARSRGLRRAAAEKQEQAWKNSFSRHDADGDGCLNRGEVEAFGKHEFEIALSEDLLDQIMRVLQPITFEKFLPLRQKVGIAKFEAEARLRREKVAQQQEEGMGETANGDDGDVELVSEKVEKVHDIEVEDGTNDEAEDLDKKEYILDKDMPEVEEKMEEDKDDEAEGKERETDEAQADDMDQKDNIPEEKEEKEAEERMDDDKATEAEGKEEEKTGEVEEIDRKESLPENEEAEGKEERQMDEADGMDEKMDVPEDKEGE
ncbi:unnamed protein product [Durusdinium trenchii]|uniref:EF-hand domain-containing protein n=1 Tax=Durusdinium trenchii TaxID=1381693 RepID=A0ABP0H9X5_9DINO